MIKCDQKKFKIGKKAILENLIPFRLININYLPRAYLEKKLVEDLFLNSYLGVIGFFYDRVAKWKQSTRYDKTSLQCFFKSSYQKEQKIALKTLIKVKTAKNLFRNGILNFSINFVE